MKLTSNLANIQTEERVDLFGDTQKTVKLSIKDRIGFLPISVWKPDWNITKEWKGLVGDAGQTRELVGKKMQLMGSKTGTSIFNPHLAMMILSAYCPQNARIYDAFGGGGTRAIVAASMGHDYTGVEIRYEEVRRVIERGLELGLKYQIECCDSSKYEIEPNSYDFSYSCPPYYDLEVYSKVEGDMSNAATYSDFLNMLTGSLKITFDGLKPGAMCVWVVGNFRDKRGALTHFSGDTARLGREVGFIFHDEIIWWGASNAAFQRAGQFSANRKSVRVHENILIFIKPEVIPNSTTGGLL